MMQVSSSTNSMEGLECSQPNGSSSSRLSLKMTLSQGSLNFSNLVEDSLEPSPMECEAYEAYLQLPLLLSMWRSREWPDWSREVMVKPALQALEMTFKLMSCILCDSRSYIDKEEWKMKLESLCCFQLELISVFCENDLEAPTVELSVGTGLLANGFSQEVWQIPGAQPVISRTSEQSLLPRLGKWKKAEQMVSRIWLGIECHMRRTPFTLGLGEPNLSSKPILAYDSVCRCNSLHSIKQAMHLSNSEDRTLCLVHQIFEAWIFVAKQVLYRVHERINSSDHQRAASDCWAMEKIWKLLTEIQNLLVLADPDDFLKLKHELAISSTSSPAGAYCLRSSALRDLTDECKELKHLVPTIMGVEADPKGGPRLQEAIMSLFHAHGFRKRAQSEPSSSSYNFGAGTIHLLLAFQAVEAAVKNFFFSYQQLVITIMGSVEMKGLPYLGASDALSQMYFEPPYFPSVDGAKTFLSEYWHQAARHGTAAVEGPYSKKQLARKSNQGKPKKQDWITSHR